MDSTNIISLKVVDDVSPEIAPKLISIAAASDKAGDSVGRLADQMATLKGSGIGTLGTLLAKLEAGTLKAAVAQGTLATAIQTTTASATNQTSALATSTTALRSVTAANASAANAAKAGTAATTASAGAVKGLVSANISGAASLGILEGRTLSMNRAATNFVTKILGLGPILQAAFPVIGAVALLAVLYQMGSALVKVVKEALNAGTEIAKAFDGVSNTLRKSTDELTLTNDKLDQTIAKLEHKPTTNGITLALDEARVMADKLDDSLERAQKSLEEVLKKNQISFGMGLLTKQGSTTGIAKDLLKQEDTIGQARDQADADNETARAAALAANAAAANLSQKERDRIASEGVIAVQKQEVTSYNDLRTAIKKVADERTAAYNKVHDSVYNEIGQDVRPAGDNKNFDAQMTELGKAAHLTQFELRDLDETQRNLVANGTADKLRDQNSEIAAGVREAAKQWKELEGAYKHFQESQASIGHKTTAKENLDALNFFGQTNNPLNADKLTALKLPQENKLAGDNFIQDESDKLSRQIATIGLYDDALKEATMLDTILQQAQKKGITLTDAQTDSFKEQIATIVESRDYQKQLQTIYESVNSAQDTYSSRVRALNTDVANGVITQAQYAQALLRTIRTFQESSSVIAAFDRKLSDEQRDSGNKLGSNQDIAAKAQLQQLAEEMRKGDSTHPGGYSETEIQATVAGKMAEVKAQQAKNAADEAANKLVYAQTNLYDELIIREKALNAAVQAGTMSQQAANAAKLQDWNQQNDQQLKSGTGGSAWKGALADYAKNFTTVADGIKQSLSGTFKTLADGIADSVGRAIAGAKNIGQALRDVAKSAVGELISSLLKLAIEYLIIDKLQKALHIKPLPVVAGPSPKQAAEGIAGMAAITVAGMVMTKLLTGPMWSLAAAMAGVTFGLSATAGAASIGALAGSEVSAAAAGGHANGGYISGPGTSRSDSILSTLSNGEYVVNAAATSQNRDLLDSINSGSSHEGITTQSLPKINGSTSKSDMNVQVHNYNGSKVEVQHMDENTVRLIVRDEGPQIVAQHAPGVIAKHIQDPNSKPSKAITRFTSATRSR